MHTEHTSAEDGGQPELPQDEASLDPGLEPEPEQELVPGPRPELEPETDSTKHGEEKERGVAISIRAAADQQPKHAPAERNASQTLVSNSGLYEREISLRAEKLARIDAQRQQKQHAEMKDVTFSPRINPALPTVGHASQAGTSRAAELKEETAARVANGFWPITPVADRQRARRERRWCWRGSRPTAHARQRSSSGAATRPDGVCPKTPGEENAGRAAAGRTQGSIARIDLAGPSPAWG